ncbi:MmpS family transport accessory protein [Mycolicibacterium hippocampi]|nr:MmpS family transport accessory protein [Mycolicibacterium hippocampi]
MGMSDRGREEQSGFSGREERSGFSGREERSGFSGREEPTQQFGYGHPGYTDPAYASQTPYGPSYAAPPPHPTEHLPAYSPYGYDPSATGRYGPPYPPGPGDEPPPPEGPKSPRWLWIVAGVAVVMVVGLVIALVIVNSSRQETVVAPLPSLPEPSFSTPTTTPRSPSTTTRAPSTPILPLPSLPSRTPSTDTTVPGATDSVVYTVGGDGRAINITYVDTGGLLQTEFNVMLPWSKEVSLPQPAEGSASISIINVGREVSCSISVNGVAVEERTGAGLTICATS